MLTTNAFENWALKLWDFDKPYRWPGKALGTGTQIGIALGVGARPRGTGRLVVDCQTDGDLMFDAGALWFAAKHKIPMLAVMHNNRAYYNDWEHQITVARQRGTPVERAYIGMDIFGPAPDFAALARSLGWYAEGPIEDPADIRGALERAIDEVKAGQPALVDTITRRRTLASSAAFGTVNPPSATIRAKMPLPAASSPKRPRSTIRPVSSTRISSALATVERRWAIMKVVRPCRNRSSARLMRASVSASSALVASSRTRIGASLSTALAMARRWRSPPDRAAPRSPMAKP